jgi:surfactin synthase thioesterase subunit
VSVKVYVEGGGKQNHALATQCRHGFAQFFEKAGLKPPMLRIVAGGSRQETYKKFRTAQEDLTSGEMAVLLVDSEGSVSGQVAEDQHFMVQAMEAWFHADKEALESFYVGGFRKNALVQRPDVENIPKNALVDSLKRATKDCQKGEYSKGDHSFKILALIDPIKVSGASPYASRLFNYLDGVCK